MDFESHSFANQTAPASVIWYYTTGTFSLLCLLCGIFTNGLVIFVFLRNKKLCRPRNYFLISLATSDLSLLVTNNTAHVIASFNKDWPFGKIGCNLYALCGGAFGLTSIATMVGIALTRLAVVMDPFSSLNLSGRCMLKYVMFSWLYGTIWMIPPIFGWNRFIFESFKTTCTFDYMTRKPWDRLYVFMLFIGGFFIPLLIILGSYTIILMKLSQRSVNFTSKAYIESNSKIQFKKSKVYIYTQIDSFQNPHSRIEKSNEKLQLSDSLRRTEVRAARTALLVLLVYCMAWGPYALVTVLSQFGFNSFFNTYSTSLFGLLTKTSACVNPLIYAFSSSKCQHQICSFLNSCRIQNRNLSSVSQSKHSNNLNFRFI